MKVLPPRISSNGRTMTIPTKPYPEYSTGMSATEEIDVRGLEKALSKTVEGEVRFDAGSRALYATDASNFRQTPIGVVIPKTLDDIVAVHAACHEYRAPILPRGCGTSLSGETVNVAVVVDVSKYLTKIVDIDPKRKIARVQPGVVHDQLVKKTKKNKLVFAPDPSTHSYCTIGGNIGNNSCGIHSVQAAFFGEGGRTSDNIAGMEILTYDGTRFWAGATSDAEYERIIRRDDRRAEIYRALRNLRDRYADRIRDGFPQIPRRVSGYNLDDLLPEKGFNVARSLVGTEGTCAMVLEADLQLVYDPPKRAVVVVGYPDICVAGDNIPDIMGQEPLACEAIDYRLFQDQKREGMHPQGLALMPDGRGWLIIEVGGETQKEANAKAKKLKKHIEDHENIVECVVYEDEEEQEEIWDVREGGLGATAFPPDDERDHWPGWEDSAVPPDKVGRYLRDLQELYDRYGYRGAIYGHFGEGCIHSRISFDLTTASGIQKYRSFLEEAADLCSSYNGSLSGEHGDGQQRAELLDKMYGEDLVDAFREFKRIWDPDWKMNPGKVVDAYRLDENLRLGADYNPPEPDTHFAYEEDGGSFTHATLRCVGVGKCRQREPMGTMCPSFQVLKEEKHTTRGRARMLFEMLQGNIVKDGWKDEDVFESLHLCLSCKGCSHECPVNVDIPTLKAEFLSKYYEGRMRPRGAYALGWIMYAARVASRMPSVANFFGQVPPFSNALKAAGGVAQQRQTPIFAARTFRDWYGSRDPVNVGKQKVILWNDTFNNYWKPETAIACVEVLEHAGFHVVLPPKNLCCGRPLYDFGFLDMAKDFLERILEAMRDDIRAGVPVIGVEPSCLAVFEDEMPKILPHNLDAQRLQNNTYQFSDFLEHVGYRPPQINRKALVHGHCHHKNGMKGMDSEQKMLQKMGLDFEIPDSGCCGMAGAFGFEAGERYEVSIGAGELVLLPKVREADKETFIISNGFSCKEQIRQQTDRRALHIAEVMKLALEHGPDGPPRKKPPEWYLRPDNASVLRGAAITAAAGAVAVQAARSYFNGKLNGEARRGVRRLIRS